MKEKLRYIRREVNDILKEAKLEPSLSSEPVNWGDVKCVEIGWMTPLDDDPYILIIISEAAPSCGKLCRYVIDELRKRDIQGVWVRTEW